MINRTMNTEEEKVVALLKGVIDPELMINIIDLGLVYDVRMDDTGKRIDIDLTLTSPGCPLGEVIMEDARQVIIAGYPDFKVAVNLVWEPMWTIENLTAAGKEALGRT